MLEKKNSIIWVREKCKNARENKNNHDIGSAIWAAGLGAQLNEQVPSWAAGGGVGSGPRYQILSHVFARCVSKKEHWHARIARASRATCKKVWQKSYTSGHCLGGAGSMRGRNGWRIATWYDGIRWLEIRFHGFELWCHMELNEIISKIHDILADIGCSAAAVPVALLLCLANFLKSKFKTQLFFRKLKLSVLCLKSTS